MKTGLLANIALTLFEIYYLGKDFTLIRREDLAKGNGKEIKWLLMREYFKEYRGLRFPRIYAERYCSDETGCKSTAIQEKFSILTNINLVETSKSESTDVDDIKLVDDFIKMMNAYYELHGMRTPPFRRSVDGFEVERVPYTDNEEQ